MERIVAYARENGRRGLAASDLFTTEDSEGEVGTELYCRKGVDNLFYTLV